MKTPMTKGSLAYRRRVFESLSTEAQNARLDDIYRGCFPADDRAVKIDQPAESTAPARKQVSFRDLITELNRQKLDGVRGHRDQDECAAASGQRKRQQTARHRTVAADGGLDERVAAVRGGCGL